MESSPLSCPRSVNNTNCGLLLYFRIFRKNHRKKLEKTDSMVTHCIFFCFNTKKINFSTHDKIYPSVFSVKRRESEAPFILNFFILIYKFFSEDTSPALQIKIAVSAVGISHLSLFRILRKSHKGLFSCSMYTHLLCISYCKIDVYKHQQNRRHFSFILQNCKSDKYPIRRHGYFHLEGRTFPLWSPV